MKKVYIGLFLSFILANKSFAEEPKVYTNEDLRHYKADTEIILEEKSPEAQREEQIKKIEDEIKRTESEMDALRVSAQMDEELCNLDKRTRKHQHDNGRLRTPV